MLDLEDFYDRIDIGGVCRQAVKTSDCGSDMRGFESHQTPHFSGCYMVRFYERRDNFNRAYDLLVKTHEAYLNDSTNDLNRLALTQSFEIVFELSWKLLKDILLGKSIDVYAPLDVIKEAFAINLLPNAQIWIDMLKSRNACSHEYNINKVNSILNNISSIYFQELSKFNDWVNNYE